MENNPLNLFIELKTRINSYLNVQYINTYGKILLDNFLKLNINFDFMIFSGQQRLLVVWLCLQFNQL